MLFTFHIQIVEISNPEVWRKITVPHQFSFLHFHHIIQAAFGWEDSHLFEFSPDGIGSSPSIGIKESDSFWSEGTADKNAARVKLSRIFTEAGQTYIYTYDFGDSWEHQITLEEIKEGAFTKAGCIAGQGYCPREDCGGVWGYRELKEIMKKPRHKEYKSMREWLGLSKEQTFDPDAFDLERTKKIL